MPQKPFFDERMIAIGRRARSERNSAPAAGVTMT
jgi:hypothetical protein